MLKSRISRLLVVVATALGMAVTLGACGGEEPTPTDPSTVPAVTEVSPAEGPGDDPDVEEQPGDDMDDQDSDASELPADFPDFPLPDEYSVLMAGSQGSAWTAVLNVEEGVDELVGFYKEELPMAGWEVTGDRPFAQMEGTEIDTNRDDLEASVAISAPDGATAIRINIVQG